MSGTGNAYYDESAVLEVDRAALVAMTPEERQGKSALALDLIASGGADAVRYGRALLMVVVEVSLAALPEIGDRGTETVYVAEIGDPFDVTTVGIFPTFYAAARAATTAAGGPGRRAGTTTYVNAQTMTKEV